MPAPDKFSFIPQGGETGALIRATAWETHPLGRPEQWPGSLKATVAVMLASRHPMMLLWGPQLYQFYNDAFIPALGLRKHPAAMGQPGAICWAEAWTLVGPQIQDALMRNKSSWNEDHCVPVSREGKIEDAYWTYGYSPVNDEHGNVVGVLNIVNETTQQVKNRRKLQNTTVDLAEARHAMQRFLMQVPVGIALLSGPNHVYTLLNPVFCDMAFGGRPASEFIGHPVREALPELEGQGFFEILDGVYRTGKPFVGVKLRASLRQANGLEREMFLNFTYQAQRDDHGRIEGILAVLYEVTDAVNAQKEIELMAESLRAAVTSRDVFLGVASHELNTPLTTLMLQAEMFQRRIERSDTGTCAPAAVQKFARDVFLQSKRLERLIDDMLDVSRLAAGKLTIAKRDCDLSAVIKDTLARFVPQLEAAGCTLQRDIKSGIYANIDTIRIEQVMSNLLVNICKYAPKTTVCLTLDCSDQTAVMRLSDTGPGIAPEHQARIFGRFERATHPNEVSGLGLGLYISEQIILDHSGCIYVHSVLGEGSAFIFELPAWRQEDPEEETG